MSVCGLHANAHFPTLDYVHRVTGIAGAEQDFLHFAVERLK